MANLDHPNDEGRWTRLELGDRAALWRRERQSFPPLTQFYLVAPPRQHEIHYDEPTARRAFETVLNRAAGIPVTDPELKPAAVDGQPI